MKNSTKAFFLLLIIFSLVGKKTANAQSITFNWNGTIQVIAGFNNYKSGTIQTWTVPNCVSVITITAAGGSGGACLSGPGGKGAVVTGTVTVTSGHVLNIIAAGQGGYGEVDGGGGGGGSYVWDATTNTILVVAGGGGGEGYNGADPNGPNGQTNNSSPINLETPTRDGVNTCGTNGVGGNGGGPGGNTSDGGACGAAGWLSNGGLVAAGTYFYVGYGYYPENGVTPGYGGIADPLFTNPYEGAGGFGGGAGGGYNGGGGGGGYNGAGGGLGIGGAQGDAGGGGGSYFNGGIATSTSLGLATSNGYVKIQWTASGVSASITAFTDPPCNGQTGTATATGTGGTAPYTYVWSPTGQTNATATGLSAGNYTVTITDHNGCTGTASVNITQPTILTTTMGTITNPPCNGGAGNAIVTAAGGTAPYTYLWAPTGGTNANGTGLTIGSYTVTVTDNHGCTATASVTITQPTLLTATTSVAQASCGGNNGSANVVAGGGTSPYTYLWTPSGQTNAIATGLSTGNYTVTVTDHNGCSITSAITVTSSGGITVTITSSVGIICNGGSTGIATASGSGGIAPYTYLWNPSAQTNATASGLSAGTYTVTVKDNNGCIGTATVAITQPTAITATTSITQASCNLSNGSATVNATGGTPGYSYLWNPSAQTNATATGLSAGTYIVTITDANGCTLTASAIVTQPSALVASICNTTGVSCNGGANGSATCCVTGGTTPYTYSWTPIGGNTANASGLSAGIYTVTVTDANGCISTAAATITQPTLLTAIIGIPTNIACNGGTANITVTAGGGTLNYAYAWTPAGGNNATATLTAGNYTVTVTDNNGCSATASVIITQPTLLTATMGTPTNILCNGGTGSASVTAGGGVLNYIYTWSPAGGSTANATGLTAGSYTVAVKDANGCIATASVAITQPVILSTSLTPSNIKCFGGNTGSIISNTIGGTVPYIYTWSNGQTSANATSLSNGSYTLTVIDANSCSATASVTLTEPNQLTASATGPQIDCSGSPIILTATASGGTLPYAYSWSPTGGNASTATVTPPITTTYIVTITDANGCTATASTTITVTAPLGLIVSGDTLICRGGRVTLRANGYGGDGIYHYLWVPSNLTTQTVTFNTTHDTTVTVQLTDDCGSSMASLSIPVSIQVLPTIAISADVMRGCVPLCVQFRDLNASSEISQWGWNFGNGDSTTKQSPLYCYKDTGSFSVSLTQTSTIGCSSTLKLVDMVTVYSPPKANFTYSPQPINILTPEVQFTDLSTDRYPIVEWNWRFGQGDSIRYLQNPNHYYPDTGTYCPTLVVMDIHGCIDSITNCLVVNPDFAFYIPDAFTPNGDGKNDIFQPKGSYIKNFEMYVFDRWGMKLFHSTDINNGWDGTTGSGTTVVQEDTYVYIINVTDSKGNTHSYTGRVNLIK